MVPTIDEAVRRDRKKKTSSSEAKPKSETHGKRWTKEEEKQHAFFYVKATQTVTRLAKHIPTRTVRQIQSYLDNHKDERATLEKWRRTLRERRRSEHQRRVDLFNWMIQQQREVEASRPPLPDYVPTEAETRRLALVRERAANGEQLAW